VQKKRAKLWRGAYRDTQGVCAGVPSRPSEDELFENQKICKRCVALTGTAVPPPSISAAIDAIMAARPLTPYCAIFLLCRAGVLCGGGHTSLFYFRIFFFEEGKSVCAARLWAYFSVCGVALHIKLPPAPVTPRTLNSLPSLLQQRSPLTHKLQTHSQLRKPRSTFHTKRYHPREYRL
jgi:hypothetical protein